MFRHKDAAPRETQTRDTVGTKTAEIQGEARMRKEMYFAVASTLRWPQ
jgi:hypothetical protein